MKKFMIVFCLSTLLFACVKVRNYKYTLLGLSEKKPGVQVLNEDTIEALTDSGAYCDAFNRYWGDVRYAEEAVKKYGSSATTPTDFILLNDQGRNIRKTVVFEHKAEREAWIKTLHDSIRLTRRPD